MTRSRTGIALLVGSVVLTAASGGAADAGRGAGRAEVPDGVAGLPVHVAQIDLASGVNSVGQLAKVGTRAVIATATHSWQDASKVDPEVVFTHQRFEIDQSLWGGDANVIVSFTGGRVHNGEHGDYLLEVEGQPQFERGRDYLLVLLGPTPSGEYWSLGGSQGRYLVADGRLEAVKGTAQGDGVGRQLDGLSVSQAVQLLTGLREAA